MSENFSDDALVKVTKAADAINSAIEGELALYKDWKDDLISEANDVAAVVEDKIKIWRRKAEEVGISRAFRADTKRELGLRHIANGNGTGDETNRDMESPGQSLFDNDVKETTNKEEIEHGESSTIIAGQPNVTIRSEAGFEPLSNVPNSLGNYHSFPASVSHDHHFPASLSHQHQSPASSSHQQNEPVIRSHQHNLNFVSAGQAEVNNDQMPAAMNTMVGCFRDMFQFMKKQVTDSQEHRYVAPALQDSSHSGNRFMFPRLQELPLPSFTGEKPHEFKSFSEAFETSIGARTDLKNSVKLQYLIECVKRPAKYVIEGLELTDENYDFAKNELNKKFGCVVKVEMAQINRLRELGKKRHPLKASELSKLYHEQRLIVHAMEQSIHLTAVHADLVKKAYPLKEFMHLISEQETRHRLSKGVSWSISELLTEINTRIEILEDQEVAEREDMEVISVNHMKEESRGIRRSHQQDKRRSQQRSTVVGRCFNCNKRGHMLRECDELKTDIKLFEFVQANHLCVLCYGKHAVDACVKKGLCRKCNGKHAIQLCQFFHENSTEEINATLEQDFQKGTSHQYRQ